MPNRPAKDTSIKIIRIMDRLNVGGPAIHAILLTRYLNPNGILDSTWQTTLVYGQEGATEGNMLGLVQQTGIHPVFISSLGRELNPFRDLVSFWKLIRLIQKEKPQIVHTHKSKAGVVGRLAARLCGVPVVVHTYHGHVLHGYFSRFKTQLFIAIERWMSRWSDQIIAVSPKVKEDLVRYGIAPAEKIHVTYLGLDLARFAASLRYRGVLKTELGLPANTPLVGVVARLVPIKRIQLFLQTAKTILNSSPEVHFVIVGDGESRAELERLSADYGLQNNVHFLGFRNDLDKIYPDLTVLTLTSANEGSPVSLIEGLASGCAVVAVNVGGVSDVVSHEKTGLLVPTQDKSDSEVRDTLAAQILNLLQHPARAHQLGQTGRADVLSRFSIERLVADLTTLYEFALSQKVL